jgi:hypothetical protein
MHIPLVEFIEWDTTQALLIARQPFAASSVATFDLGVQLPCPPCHALLWEYEIRLLPCCEKGPFAALACWSDFSLAIKDTLSPDNAEARFFQSNLTRLNGLFSITSTYMTNNPQRPRPNGLFFLSSPVMSTTSLLTYCLQLTRILLVVCAVFTYRASHP